jgi:hypothetical protein
MKSYPALAALTAVAASLAMPLAQAQTQTQIYKWTGTDGVTSYSQTPPPQGGGRNVQTITVDTLPPEQQQAARRMLGHMEAQANAQAAAIRNRFAQADENVSRALRSLQDAEDALSAGSQPGGSDFIGNFGGGTRLRESYFQRVAQLEANVRNARAALDAAYNARNAAR